jgi:toxin ParE1/3/4
MKLPLVLRPEAEKDLLSARDWYDGQRTGLGEKFAAEAVAALGRISAMPEAFALKWEDVRSSRMRRFPYVVY